MRTIVINTLGTAYARNDIYFLAFAPDQIIWLDSELDHLHDCVQMIRQIQYRQSIREDYHMIVLFNLEMFSGSDHKDYRDRLQNLLRALLVDTILAPLDEESLTPLSVTAIFLNINDIDNATSPFNTYCAMLDLRADDLKEKIELTYQSEDNQTHCIDLTDILQLNLLRFKEGPKPSKSEPVLEAAVKHETFPGRLSDTDDWNESHIQTKIVNSQQTLETAIYHAVEGRQSIRLRKASGRELKIQSLEYQARIDDQKAIQADLQINLARLIRSSENAEKPDISIVYWHDPEELSQLMADAEATVREQFTKLPHAAIYHDFDDFVSDSDSAELEKEIFRRLREQEVDLPGVKEVLESIELEDGLKDTLGYGVRELDDSMISQVRKDMRKGILLLWREKKRFRSRYHELMDEYELNKAREEQRAFYDICADAYSAWRTRQRLKKPCIFMPPTQATRPTLQIEKTDELMEAKKRCAEGVLSQLDDYADVREEAAALYADFETIGRLWSPDMHRLSTRYFYRFSAVMGLVFLILMLLPFFLISSQAADLRISRIAAFVINAAFFFVLYVIGFMHWIRMLAGETRELRVQLELLLLKSEEKRKCSVFSAIKTYAKELPVCLIRLMNYNHMLEIDANNQSANEKYEEHMTILNNVLKEINDIRTSLRAKNISAKGEADKRTINLLKAPYDPENKGIYMFFDERRVKGIAAD